MAKNLFIKILFFLFFLALLFFGAVFPHQERKNPNQQPLPFLDMDGQKDDQKRPAVLFFTGDIMLDRGVEWMAEKKGEGNAEFPFLDIKEFLKQADFLFGNLEGPVSDKGAKAGSIYSFRADPKFLKGLKEAGFDAVSVANNHMMDYGGAAMEDTFLRLKSEGIDYAGGGFSEEEAFSAKFFDILGQKVAILAFTSVGSEKWAAQGDRSGIAWAGGEISGRIEDAAKEAPIVIVSFHWGQEYQKENDQSQKYLAHLAVDKGADLVVGHHPHVVQNSERYKDGYIFYSLGNFIFDQSFSEETMEGLLLKVVIDDNGIKEVSPVAIQMNEKFQPEIKKQQNEIQQ